MSETLGSVVVLVSLVAVFLAVRRASNRAYYANEKPERRSLRVATDEARADAIGNGVFSLVYYAFIVGLCLLGLYGVVQFVKWSWTN